MYVKKVAVLKINILGAEPCVDAGVHFVRDRVALGHIRVLHVLFPIVKRRRGAMP
jgi:hypothetical protein